MVKGKVNVPQRFWSVRFVETIQEYLDSGSEGYIRASSDQWITNEFKLKYNIVTDYELLKGCKNAFCTKEKET